MFRVSKKVQVVEYESKKLPMKFDISMLNMLIGYLFKSSTQVTRKSLNNMKKLFDMIDENVYEGNDQLEARLYFINKALEARVLKGFENESMVIQYCRTDSYNKQIEDIINSLEIYKRINYEEIKYINKAIQDRLKYSYVLTYKDRIYKTIERLDADDYDTYQEINDELATLCSKFLTETRRVNVLDDVNTFSLDPEVVDENLTDIVNKLKDPSRILKCGIQKLNQILAPGYMSKRLYTYLGLPAGFKSGILLKTALDIKKYNKGMKTKKPGKRPCVLLVTMENSVEESIERIFNMTTTTNDIRNYTAKQVIKMLKEDGSLTLQDENDIDIIIKYYPNRSIDTSDLYTIIDDLNDENKEVIALILDYIKRIKPAERSKDEKEELKNITNELKNLATELDIPVITAHQMNRAGAGAIDTAIEQNKEDLARFVGRSNVGSAWEIIENSDWTCLLVVEKKKGTDQYYLSFKRVKLRYRDPNDLTLFSHPFVAGNKIQLIDDLNSERSLSEESLATDFEDLDSGNKKGKRNAVSRPIIDDNDTDDVASLFDFSNTLNVVK